MDEEKRLDGRKRLPTAREGSLGDDGTGMGSEWEFSTGASGYGVDIGAPGGAWERASDAMLLFHETWMTCGPGQGKSSDMLLARWQHEEVAGESDGNGVRQVDGRGASAGAVAKKKGSLRSPADQNGTSSSP